MMLHPKHISRHPTSSIQGGGATSVTIDSRPIPHSTVVPRIVATIE